jgi:ribosomal protein L2
LNNFKIKKLVCGFKKDSGRSSFGKITVFSKSKKLYNYINVDYLRNRSSDTAVCLNNLKNTTTNNIISLIKYSNGSYSYILNAYGYSVGMFTQFLTKNLTFSSKYLIGSAVFIKNLTAGSMFFNVCDALTKKSMYARSPGTYCILLNSDNLHNLIIQLPSGEVRTISLNFICVLGRNSNL